MKRDREDEDESSLIRSSRAFRCSPERTCSKTINSPQFLTISPSHINNNNNNNDNNAVDFDNTIKDTSNNSSSNNKNNNNKDPDRFLPIANVGRIMKKVIPGNGKISKDAKETVQECVSEFISFVTVEASDKCQREKRKTINGDDILWAITTLGFDDYVDPLKLYLSKYREVEGEKMNMSKHRVEEFWPRESKPEASYNSMFSSMSTIHLPSLGSNDPPLSLNIPQSSGQSQQDHVHGNW